MILSDLPYFALLPNPATTTMVFRMTGQPRWKMPSPRKIRSKKEDAISTFVWNIVRVSNLELHTIFNCWPFKLTKMLISLINKSHLTKLIEP